MTEDDYASAGARFSRGDLSLLEVRGCLSRTDWEIVYLAAVQFAQQHGLTIECFDLKPAEFEEENDLRRQSQVTVV
jgi:hypothetical protein